MNDFFIHESCKSESGNCNEFIDALIFWDG